MKRKFLALIILLGGILISFLIIFDHSSTDLTLSKTISKGQIFSPSYNLNFENRIENQIPILKNINYQQNQKENNNLTQNLTQKILEEIRRKNENFPANPQLENLNIPSQDLINQIFREELRKGLDIPQISLKEIKITSDNSEQKKLEYIKNLNQLTQKYDFKKDFEKAAQNFLKNQETSYFKPLITNLNKLHNEIKALEVPSDWQFLHLQILNFQLKQKSFLEGFLILYEDPIKASLVLEQFNNLIEENDLLQNLIEKEFGKFAQKL